MNRHPRMGLLLLGFCLLTKITAARADPFRWVTTVVDNTNSGYTSMAILPSGYPAISYEGSGALKYASYNGSEWQRTLVDAVSGVSTGEYSSLAILPSGQPAIGYIVHYPSPDWPVAKYAWFDGAAWQNTRIDSEGWSLEYTSLGILPSGYPAVASSDSYDGRLRLSQFDGASWWSQTIQNTDSNFRGVSMAILPSGDLAIAFVGAFGWPPPAHYLSYGWGNGDAWHWGIVEEWSNAGGPCSLAILPSGDAAIAYQTNGHLKYARQTSGQWQVTTVDDAASATQCSLRILPSGQPAIGYRGYGSAGLKYAWFDGSVWQTSLVGASGDYLSMAILPSGRPALSYVSARLMYATAFSVGDLNCDGVVNFADIDPFVLLLTSHSAYVQQYPDCNWLTGDCNGDGWVDFADIDPFVALLSQ